MGIGLALPHCLASACQHPLEVSLYVDPVPWTSWLIPREVPSLPSSGGQQGLHASVPRGIVTTGDKVSSQLLRRAQHRKQTEHTPSLSEKEKGSPPELQAEGQASGSHTLRGAPRCNPGMETSGGHLCTLPLPHF